jgi:hypothetical protein
MEWYEPFDLYEDEDGVIEGEYLLEGEDWPETPLEWAESDFTGGDAVYYHPAVYVVLAAFSAALVFLLLTLTFW